VQNQRHFSRNRRPTRYFIRRDCARTKFLHLVDISTWAANLTLCDISNVDAKSAICSAGCCDGMVTRGVLREMLEQGRTKEVRSRTNLRNHEKVWRERATKLEDNGGRNFLHSEPVSRRRISVNRANSE
jgi:hypothetical protein